MNAFRNALAASTMLIPGHALAESAAEPSASPATALEDLGGRLEHWLTYANSEYQKRIVRRLSVPGGDESAGKAPATPVPPVIVAEPKPADVTPRALAEEKRAESPAVATAIPHEDVRMQPPAASLPLAAAGPRGGQAAREEQRAEPAPVLAGAPPMPFDEPPPSPPSASTPAAEVHPPVSAGTKEPGEPAQAPPPGAAAAATVGPEPSASPPAKDSGEAVPPNFVKEAEDSAGDALDTAKRRLEEEKRARGASREASIGKPVPEGKLARHVRHGTARRDKSHTVLAETARTEKPTKKRAARDRGDETPKRRVKPGRSAETEVASKASRSSGEAHTPAQTAKSEPAHPKTRIKVATAAENRPLRAVLDQKPQRGEAHRRAAAKKPSGGTAGKAEAARRDDADREGMHVVKAGDSLWRIAKRRWGAGEQYVLIYRANRSKVDDPDLIYPGQKLVIPKA